MAQFVKLVCKQCKIEFIGQRSKYLEQQRCSRKCHSEYCKQLKVHTICPICQTIFRQRQNTGKQKFCSKKCAGFSNRGRRLSDKVCEGCGKTFSPSYARLQYCSSSCWYEVNTNETGSSVLRRTHRDDRRLEWYVKIDNKGKGGNKGRWKRKAAVILGELLGRQLTQTECTKIKYVNGDSTDCRLGNLLLESPQGILVCKLCGSHKTSRRGSIYLTTWKGMCFSCYHSQRKDNPSMHMRESAKLTEREVMIIRRVLKDSKNFHGLCGRIAGWFCTSSGIMHSIKHRKTWKEILPMAKQDLWKALLEQHDKLRKLAGVTLYDRVTLLAKVYEDPQFVVDMKADGKSHIEELDKRVSDTCANFTELLQMLKMFPRRQSWSSGDLSAMRLKMLDKLRGKQKKQQAKKGDKEKEDNGRHNRRTATLAQVNERDAEIERLKSELKTGNQLIKSLEMQLETMQGALETSRQTIGSLNETVSLFKLTQEQREKETAPKRKRATAK